MGNGEHHRILLVDDDRFIRNLLVTLLREVGFTVMEAANGADALAAVSRELPNLILLDLAMPVMDGRTFYRQLRSAHDAASIPAIVLSAHGAREAQQALGAQAAFDKPFDLDDVVREVHRLITARRTEPQRR